MSSQNGKGLGSFVLPDSLPSTCCWPRTCKIFLPQLPMPESFQDIQLTLLTKPSSTYLSPFFFQRSRSMAASINLV